MTLPKEAEEVRAQLVKSIDDFLQYCISTGDLKRFRRLARNVNDFMRKETSRAQLKALDIEIREDSVEIIENGQSHLVEICRNKDGTIWGVYSDKPINKDMVFADGVRNILILAKKGVLKLEDVPRRKKC